MPAAAEQRITENAVLLPRLGLVYQPTVATSLYASFTESFNPQADNYTLGIQVGSFSYATPAQLRQPPRQPLAVSVAALLAETQRRLPGLVPRTVSFPQQVGGPVGVSGTFAADWALWGVPSGADFDARTGRLLAVRDGRRAPVGAKALMAFENLHFGRYGGWPGQLLYCLGGLVAGSLPITGWLLWWGKRRARRRSTKNAAE